MPGTKKTRWGLEHKVGSEGAKGREEQERAGPGEPNHRDAENNASESKDDGRGENEERKGEKGLGGYAQDGTRKGGGTGQDRTEGTLTKDQTPPVLSKLGALGAAEPNSTGNDRVGEGETGEGK